MENYYDFDVDAFCEQLTDEWVLKEDEEAEQK